MSMNRQRWPRTRMITGIGLIGFVLMSRSLWAAQAGQAGDRHLEGIVLDQQGLPIPGAQIVATEQQGGVRKTAISSTTRFRIDGLVPGLYDVRVAAPGFAPKTETVDLRTASDATLDIKLE